MFYDVYDDVCYVYGTPAPVLSKFRKLGYLTFHLPEKGLFGNPPERPFFLSNNSIINQLNF